MMNRQPNTLEELSEYVHTLLYCMEYGVIDKKTFKAKMLIVIDEMEEWLGIKQKD